MLLTLIISQRPYSYVSSYDSLLILLLRLFLWFPPSDSTPRPHPSIPLVVLIKAPSSPATKRPGRYFTPPPPVPTVLYNNATSKPGSLNLEDSGSMVLRNDGILHHSAASEPTRRRCNIAHYSLYLLHRQVIINFLKKKCLNKCFKDETVIHFWNIRLKYTCFKQKVCKINADTEGKDFKKDCFPWTSWNIWGTVKEFPKQSMGTKASLLII